MRLSQPLTRRKLAFGIGLSLVASLATAVWRTIAAAGAGTVDPWAPEQTVQPAALAKELADSKPSDKPVVVCVAPHALYLGGHIPDALYHGAGNAPQGIDDLKQWARPLARSANIVMYCGCCPIDHCPNLRPAFTALRTLGFTHTRALLIATNFYTDWVTPGYPYEKSPAN